MDRELLESFRVVKKFGNGQSVSVNDMLKTSEGKKYLVEQTIQKITAGIHEMRANNRGLVELPFQVESREQSQLDLFLSGFSYQPAQRMVPVISAAELSKLTVFRMLAVQVGVAMKVFSKFSDLSVIHEFLYATKGYSMPGGEHLNMILRSRKIVQREVSSHPMHIFDAATNCSLADIIAYHRQAVVQFGQRKTFFVLPFTQELFMMCFNREKMSIDIVVDTPFYNVIVKEEDVCFSGKGKGESFVISRQAYCEMILRNRVMLAGKENDIQVEVHANYHGWRVMKMLDVDKQFRGVEGEKLFSGLEREKVVKLRLVHSFTFGGEGVERKDYIVEDKYYRNVREYASKLSVLNYNDIYQYAEAQAFVVVSVGTTRKLSNNGLTADQIIAVSQSVFREVFNENGQYAAVISSHKSSIKSGFFGGLPDRKFYLMIGTLVASCVSGCAVASASTTCVGQIAYVVGKMTAGAIFTKYFDKFMRLLFVYAQGLSERYMSCSESLEIPESFYAYQDNLGFLPLEKRKMNFGSTPIVDRKLRKVACYGAGGQRFLRVDSGDVFDADGNTYVQAYGIGEFAGEVELFTKVVNPAMRYKLGDLYCSVASPLTVPNNYITFKDGDKTTIRRLFTNGDIVWMNGDSDYGLQKVWYVNANDRKTRFLVSIVKGLNMQRNVVSDSVRSSSAPEMDRNIYMVLNEQLSKIGCVAPVDMSYGQMMGILGREEESIPQGFVKHNGVWLRDDSVCRLGKWIEKDERFDEVLANGLLVEEVNEEVLLTKVEALTLAKSIGRGVEIRLEENEFKIQFVEALPEEVVKENIEIRNKEFENTVVEKVMKAEPNANRRFVRESVRFQINNFDSRMDYSEIGDGVIVCYKKGKKYVVKVSDNYPTIPPYYKIGEASAWREVSYWLASDLVFEKIVK